jgi:rare lipoprotein A
MCCLSSFSERLRLRPALNPLLSPGNRNSLPPVNSRRWNTVEGPLVTNKRVATTKKHTPFLSKRNAAETQVAAHGIASFYTEGTQTASGERFDTYELTAAHPTLPFGTRLRVTNVATGRSVTVRVNDRGPFVPGRVVDVSCSAAERLGMVRGGIAKVKLDVVH